MPTKANELTQSQNKLRIWRVTNFDNDGNGKHSNYFPVETVQEAVRLIHALTEIDLQSENEVVSNAFGLEEYVEDEWMEWESVEGESIDDLLEEYEDSLESE